MTRTKLFLTGYCLCAALVGGFIGGSLHDAWQAMRSTIRQAGVAAKDITRYESEIAAAADNEEQLREAKQKIAALIKGKVPPADNAQSFGWVDSRIRFYTGSDPSRKLRIWEQPANQSVAIGSIYRTVSLCVQMEADFNELIDIIRTMKQGEPYLRISSVIQTYGSGDKPFVTMIVEWPVISVSHPDA